jgi:hypothetical protein
MFVYSLYLFSGVDLFIRIFYSFVDPTGDWGCDPLNNGEPYLKCLLLHLVISTINHNVKRLATFAETGSMSPPSSPTSASSMKISEMRHKSKKIEKYPYVDLLSLTFSGSLIASKLLQLNTVFRKEDVFVSTHYYHINVYYFYFYRL